MEQTFKTKQIAVSAMCIHPRNVRAGSGVGYRDADIAPLAANIASCGLIQPLLVTEMPEGSESEWGVIAGGRRLTALRRLADDPGVAEFEGATKVMCRIVPKAMAEMQSTLSFAENETQVPMGAIERFEAFSAMQERDGADVATIAQRFAITERTVKEALRLGSVHPDIREAHRAGDLSLDALKAFVGHPEQAVQLEAFEVLGANAEAWSIKRYFETRYVRFGDPLGALVKEAYLAAGGAVVSDLIEEDSILEDRALIERLKIEAVEQASEARRAALGLAWCEVVEEIDYQALSQFGRIYPEARELTEAETEELSRLEARQAEVGELLRGELTAAEDEQLSAEYSALEEQILDLREAYAEADAESAGVITVWTGASIRHHEGLVRPADKADEPEVTQAKESQPNDWPTALCKDMAHLRTRAVGLELAQSPAIARLYADFVLVSAILAYDSFGTNGTTLKASIASPSRDEAEGQLKQIEDAHQSLCDALSVDWLALPREERFAAFAELDEGARDQLVAYAVAQTLTPELASARQSAARAAVEAEVLGDLRKVWTPDEAYFGRLTKPALLGILRDGLGLPEAADARGNYKKGELVRYVAQLFVTPPAGASEDTLARLASWTPEAMQPRQAAPKPVTPTMVEEMSEAA